MVNLSHHSYRYHLHPLFKLSFLFGFTFIAFLPEFYLLRMGILTGEILLAIIIQLKWQKIRGFIRFLLVNILGFYFIFYLAMFNWWDAFLQLVNYSLILFSMGLATFLFIEATPPREIVQAFRSIYLPSKLAIALTAVISIIPLFTEFLRDTIIFQQARGYRVRFWRLGPIIIPTILQIMKLSMELSISLESRGFQT